MEETTIATPEIEEGNIHVPGLVSVIVFYLVILGIGIGVAWWKKLLKTRSLEEVVLAGRNIGLGVGIITTAATWVGGGYINGTAEYTATPGYGLAWTQAPFCFTLSLFCNAFLFSKQLREKKYLTMLDPFEQKYGKIMAGLLYIPALCGELFWSAAILGALGASLQVILNISQQTSILISGLISMMYTLIGGLYSVAFTDVVQTVFIIVGLWLGVGYGLQHEAVTDIRDTATGGGVNWVGEVPTDYWLGNWIDTALLIIIGGIPWQVFYQRVLSARTPQQARTMSIWGGVLTGFLSIPAFLIGAIGASTDWTQTDYVKYRASEFQGEYSLMLPLVLRYLTPTPVAVIGLGAVSAAVMSSTDSSMLSSASMFTLNIFKPFFETVSKREASETAKIWVMRSCVVVLCVIAMVLAIEVTSIYGLYLLCSDLVYCVLTPQLFCVVYMKHTNSYGSLAGYIISFIIRLTGGEPLFNFKAAVEYPWYDEASGTQLFPFKTLAMLCNLVAIILVSLITRWLFTRGVVSQRFDVMQCYGDSYDLEKYGNTHVNKGYEAEAKM